MKVPTASHLGTAVCLNENGRLADATMTGFPYALGEGAENVFDADDFGRRRGRPALRHIFAIASQDYWPGATRSGGEYLCRRGLADGGHELMIA